MVVTFEKEGKSCVSEYDNKTEKKICELLHNSDIRVQLAKYLRNEFKNGIDNASDISLGYVLQEMKIPISRISNIKFHYNKTLNNFGVVFPKLKQSKPKTKKK